MSPTVSYPDRKDRDTPDPGKARPSPVLCGLHGEAAQVGLVVFFDGSAENSCPDARGRTFPRSNWRCSARFKNGTPTNERIQYEMCRRKPIKQRRLYGPARHILENDALPGLALLIVCSAILQAWPSALV